VLVCWWRRIDWCFARLTAPVVTAVSIILHSNNIEVENIPVPAKPGPPGKWPLKRRENDLDEIIMLSLQEAYIHL